MNIQKSVILLVGALLLLPFFAKSQTYITPMIGYDLLKWQPTEEGWPSRNLKEGYTTRSFVFNIRIKKNLTNKISLSWIGSFTNKRTKAAWRDVTDKLDTGFGYGLWKNEILVDYKLVKNLSLSVGGSFNYLSNPRFIFNNKLADKMAPNRKSLGILVYPEYEFKNIVLNVYYHKTLFTFGTDSKLHFKNNGSFGVRVGYKFMLSKNK